MIIARKHTEPRFDEFITGNQIVQRAVTLWADDRKVSLAFSDYSTGISPRQTHRYWSWQTNQVLGFYKMPNGTLLPYHRMRNQGNKGKFRNALPNMAFDLLDGQRNLYAGTTDLSFEYRDAMLDKFGVSSLKDIYPIAGMYEINSYLAMPHGIRTNMRELEFKDYVTKTFGKTQVRRDLVRASANVPPYLVDYAKEFRGLVPVDWIVTFLRNNSDVTNFVLGGVVARPHYHGRLRGFLRQVDRRTLRSLLNAHMTGDEWHNLLACFPSPAHNWNQVNLPLAYHGRFDSWNAIHDVVLEVRRPVRNFAAGGIVRTPYVPPVYENKPVTKHEFAKPFDNLVAGDMVLKLPVDSDMMNDWSDKMSNCIRSYFGQADAGRGIYLGIYRNDELIGNIEINQTSSILNGKVGENTLTLAQLLGKYNLRLPNQDIKLIEHALSEKGVMITGNYWGAAERTVENLDQGFAARPVANVQLDW